MSITVDGTSDLTSKTPEIAEDDLRPPARPTSVRPRTRLVKLVRWSQHVAKGVDQWSHGYVPFLLWLALLFGGIWFPATGYLNAIFGAGDVPRTALTLNSDKLGLWGAVCVMPFCMLFWTWTNLAFLCVMASSMGEVNRWNVKTAKRAERFSRTGVDEVVHGPDKPDYRMACTRAFFVYLFTLLNELAVLGSLTPSGGGEFVQGGYTRIAVLSSLLCFIASYRPSFYEGLVSRFGDSQSQADHTKLPQRTDDDNVIAPAKPR